MSWLDAVRTALEDREAASALDPSAEPCRVYFRDDDAGWGDARLLALLDVFEAARAPVDVAVIPAEVTSGLAAALSPRAERGAIGLHQHGCAHLNHEPAGRKCEFGPARTFAEQVADLRTGRDRLAAHFGDLVDPIFTPPWNRCTPATAAAVSTAGLTVLSRDATAAPLGNHGLTEVPVHVDWFGHRKGVRWSPAELGARIAAGLAEPGPLGIMLHHAVTEPAELDDLGSLVRLLGAHPGARLVRIMEAATHGGSGEMGQVSTLWSPARPKRPLAGPPGRSLTPAVGGGSYD